MKEAKRVLTIFLLAGLVMALMPPSLFSNFLNTNPPQAEAPEILDIDLGTIDTTDLGTAFAPTYMRKTIFALDRYWAFYWDNTAGEYVWRSSDDDGATWSAENTLYAGQSFISVWHDPASDVIWYLRMFGGGTIFSYRNGTLQSDGSIDWAAPQRDQTVDGGNITLQNGFIMRKNLGSTEYVFVAAENRAGTTRQIVINRFDVAADVWETVATWSSGLTTGNLGVHILETTAGLVVSASSGAIGGSVKMVIINGNSNGDAGSWGTPILTADNYNFAGSSAIARADKIHYIMKLAVDNSLVYFNYTWNAAAEAAHIEIQAAPTSGVGATITKWGSTGLWVFWNNLNGDILYGKNSSSNGGSWGDKLTIADTEDGATQATSSYQTLTKISLGWVNSAGIAPFSIRHAAIESVGVAPFNVDLDVSLADANIEITTHNFIICDSVYLFEGETYNIPVNISRIDGGPSVAQIGAVYMQFSDTVSNMSFTGNLTRNSWTVQSGEDAINVGIGTIERSDPTSEWVVVTFAITLTPDVVDSRNRQLLIRLANTTGGAFWADWQELDVSPTMPTFEIYNQGGLRETSFSGTGARIAGGDTFEMLAAASGSIETNQTWRKLQAWHTQFTIRHVDATDGEGNADYWQDPTHDFGGTEVSSEQGDFTLQIFWYYCDQEAEVWVEGWRVDLVTALGDIGSIDFWTSFNATWYQSGQKINSEVFYSFVERDPQAAVRIWVDMWFNQINASTVHGGRINPYYYGMHDDPFLLWSNWSPFNANASETFHIEDNLNDAGTIMASRQLDLMKIGLNLTLIAGAGSDGNLETRVIDFDIQDLKTTNGRMVGVQTPIKVATRVPDMEVGGFLAPLFSALGRIGAFIIDALYAAGLGIWHLLAGQAPWFTDFWVITYDVIANGFVWVPLIGDVIFTFFDLVKPYTGFLGQGVEMFSGMVGLIRESTALLGGNLQPVLYLLFLGFFVFPVMQKIMVGDWRGFKEEIAWGYGLINTLFTWLHKFMKFVIDFIMGVIPF